MRRSYLERRPRPSGPPEPPGPSGAEPIAPARKRSIRGRASAGVSSSGRWPQSSTQTSSAAGSAAAHARDPAGGAIRSSVPWRMRTGAEIVAASARKSQRPSARGRAGRSRSPGSSTRAPPAGRRRWRAAAAGPPFGASRRGGRPGNLDRVTCRPRPPGLETGTAYSTTKSAPEALSELRSSPSGLVIEAWLGRLFRPQVSNSLAYEYQEVLSRKLSPRRWIGLKPVLGAPVDFLQRLTADR